MLREIAAMNPGSIAILEPGESYVEFTAVARAMREKQLLNEAGNLREH